MDDLGHNDIGVNTYPKANPYPESGPAPRTVYQSEFLPEANLAQSLTPAIDSLAEDGLQLTRFYSSRICSPSRASLMTGRYDRRAGVADFVFFPNTGDGLNTYEIGIAELMRQEGYATGMVGKWHLGYNPNAHEPFQTMPTRFGFQEFFGSPHSNDMSAFDLIQNETILESNFKSAEQQAEITWRYTEYALDFIQRKTAEDQPFFLYFAQIMTHIPCWPSDREFTNTDGSTWPKFQGTTSSYYYDVVSEVNHSVSRVLQALDDLDIADNTVVIFTSDNGPWLSLENKNWTDRSVGSAYPLKGAKFGSNEGGVRVPCLVRWPDVISPGTVSDEVTGLIDLFPTFVELAGGQLPTDRTIDGVSLFDLWSDSANTSIPRIYSVHNTSTEVKAVIKGGWKLKNDNLFNLAADIQEQKNVASDPSNAAILAELQAGRSAINQSMENESTIKINYTSYEVELSALDVEVSEGGTASFEVSLSADPGKVVTVSVARFSGDTDLSIRSGSKLVFDASTWSTAQTVILTAAQDTDDESDGATLQIVTDDDSNAMVREVFAFEVDDESAAVVQASVSH